MPYPGVDHETADVHQGRAVVDDDQIARHDLCGLRRLGLGEVGERGDEVPLGHETDEAVLAPDEDDADLLRGELLGDLAERGPRVDGGEHAAGEPARGHGGDVVRRCGGHRSGLLGAERAVQWVTAVHAPCGRG